MSNPSTPDDPTLRELLAQTALATADGFADIRALLAEQHETQMNTLNAIAAKVGALDRDVTRASKEITLHTNPATHAFPRALPR